MISVSDPPQCPSYPWEPGSVCSGAARYISIIYVFSSNVSYLFLAPTGAQVVTIRVCPYVWHKCIKGHLICLFLAQRTIMDCVIPLDLKYLVLL